MSGELRLMRSDHSCRAGSLVYELAQCRVLSPGSDTSELRV